MKNKKFVSIIWGYHKQIFSFEKEQNYHMLPIEVMKEEGYECEIYSIDSQVKIEDDPNFVEGLKVIYYNNIFQYLFYLFKNRKNIIYSNSLTIKTLLVGLIGKKTIFMAHDQVLPLESKKIKRFIVLFFYKFFSFIRVINKGEKKLLLDYDINSFILPLPISNKFLLNLSILINKNGGFFVGNLYSDKNPEFLIRTCKILKNKNINFKIKIAGEDRYNKNGKSFSDLIKDNNLSNYIEILGFIPHTNLMKELKKSLIFINTSISEGQCLAAYEAALAGNILCLQNILSFPSVFLENALYHNNHKELADNIIYFLNNKEKSEKMIENNQNMILREYNYKKIKKNTKKMFLNLNK